MSGIAFFQTRMGRKFFESDVPEIVSCLKALTGVMLHEPDGPTIEVLEDQLATQQRRVDRLKEANDRLTLEANENAKAMLQLESVKNQLEVKVDRLMVLCYDAEGIMDKTLAGPSTLAHFNGACDRVVKLLKRRHTI